MSRNADGTNKHGTRLAFAGGHLKHFTAQGGVGLVVALHEGERLTVGAENLEALPLGTRAEFVAAALLELRRLAGDDWKNATMIAMRRVEAEIAARHPDTHGGAAPPAEGGER